MANQWKELIKEAMGKMGKRSRAKKREAKRRAKLEGATNVATNAWVWQNGNWTKGTSTRADVDEWDDYGVKKGSNLWQKRCGNTHIGFKEVFSVEKARIFAGSHLDFNEKSDWALAIVCAGQTLTPTHYTSMSASARTLLGRSLNMHEVPWVCLGWVDGSTPPVTAREWQNLVQAIKKIDGKIAVYCMGGHGRTGTALAIIACLAGLVPRETCPVQWVRDRYCPEAVESLEQINYIANVTGRIVYEHGAWFNSYSQTVKKYDETGKAQTITRKSADDMCPDCMCDPSLIADCPLPDCKERPKREAEKKAYISPPSPTITSVSQTMMMNTGSNQSGKVFQLVRTDGNGALQKPVTNAAGDVIGYEYVEQEVDPQTVATTANVGPWHHWGK